MDEKFEKDDINSYDSTNTDENTDSNKNNEEIDDDSEQNGISSYLPVIRVSVSHFKRPILIALFFSGLLAWFTSWTGIQEIIIPDDPSSGFLNGLFFTIIAGISSVFIYILVKKRGEIALKYLMGVSFLILTFLLLFFFGDLILIQLVVYNTLLYEVISIIYITLCGFFTIFLIYKYFSDKMSPKLRNTYVLMVGILIGAFMGVIIGSWTTLSLLIGISLWDIISVKKGPIKKIMELIGNTGNEIEETRDEDEALLDDLDYFEFAELDIGIGDIAFYSMLTSHTLVAMAKQLIVLTDDILISFIVAVIVAIITGIGILIGANLTINSLKKNKILPGLPLSIFIGMALAFLSGLISYFILNALKLNGFFIIP